MGRSHPPKTIQVILPPTTSTTSTTTASSSKTTLSASTRTDHPSLQVLILAQEIARERGQHFDLGSFLTPSQRKEYHRLVHGVEGEDALEAPNSPVNGQGGGGEGQVDGDVTLEEDTDQSTRKTAFDHVGEVTGPSQNSTPLPTSGTPAPEPSQPMAAVDAPPTPTSTALTETIAAKRARIQGMNIHWTQRRKKLQELAKLESEGITELPLSPQEKPPPLPEIGLASSFAVPSGKGKEVDKGSIQASVSYWNHLLTVARKERGPQWDYNTQSYHVDRSSSDYYTHMNKAPAISEPVQTSEPNKGEPSNSRQNPMTNGYHDQAVKMEGDLAKRMYEQRRSNSISQQPPPTQAYPSDAAHPPRSQAFPAASPSTTHTPHLPPQYQPSPVRPPAPNPPQTPHHAQSGGLNPANLNLPPDYQRRISQQSNSTPQPQTAVPQSHPINPSQMQFTPQQLAQIAQMSAAGGPGGMNLNPALLQQLQAQAHMQSQGSQNQSQGGINLAQMQQQLARANQMAQQPGTGQNGYPQPQQGQPQPSQSQGQPNPMLQLQQLQLAQLAAAQNQGQNHQGGNMTIGQNAQAMRGVNPAMLANRANMQNAAQSQARNGGGINPAQMGGMGQFAYGQGQPGIGMNGIKGNDGLANGATGQNVMLGGGGNNWQDLNT
ncbi:hypothetical protein BD324DRAFT_615195 [Kockovaella imperatae]|uniref:Uncharacterized protein n=1 Tax=Kockovaella imperatae TaxID=4999 RepID=A0A1Y1URR6_9TREE|nr:hypothetical protein BD324DRAFT_615195 [Kockovaella imperatae]ORX39835.1 hypothetical protein BD324DRAFT_615195 [Kockovaella imperatae]